MLLGLLPDDEKRINDIKKAYERLKAGKGRMTISKRDFEEAKEVYVLFDEISLTHKILTQLKRMDGREKRYLSEGLKDPKEDIANFESALRSFFDGTNRSFRSVEEAHDKIKKTIDKFEEVFSNDFSNQEDMRLEKLSKLDKLFEYACNEGQRRMSDFLAFATDSRDDAEISREMDRIKADHYEELNTLTNTLLANRDFHEGWKRLVDRTKVLSAIFKKLATGLAMMKRYDKKPDIALSSGEKDVLVKVKSFLDSIMREFKQEYSGGGSRGTVEGMLLDLGSKLDYIVSDVNRLFGKKEILKEDVNRLHKVLKAYLATHPFIGSAQWKVA